MIEQRTRRVLIVEDSTVMRELLVTAFRGQRNTVIEQAGDGVAAIQALRKSSAPFDLIVLDLNMPVMGGLKFLQLLRNEPSARSTVVVVVTTEEGTDAEVLARGHGAKYFLRKPIKRHDIEKIVDRVFS